MTAATNVPRHQPPWPQLPATCSIDGVLVILSDIEMGAGGPTDDFPQSAWLGDLLLGYCQGPFADVPVTLVFNGDTFDFLKTSHEGCWPTHVDSDIALAKLRRIAAAHPDFFSAVRAFVSHARARRRVAYVIGNHDPELCLPEVQAALRDLCGGSAAIEFPGLSMRIGDVHIEHGCQADPLFAFDPSSLTLRHGDRSLLNLPWGSVALLEVAIPLTPLLHHHDRIKPRDELLELLPDLKRLLLGAFWRYWTRDYWQRYFDAQDPLRRLSWTMLREIAYRFAAGAMDVNLGDTYHRLVRADEDIRLCVVGHSHEAGWFSAGPKKLLQTGCFRNEFALLGGGGEQVLLPKVYAEVYMSGAHSVRSHLVEVDGPPPPPGYVPDSVFTVTDELRRLLTQRSLAGDSEVAARELQEAREAKDARGLADRFDLLRNLKRALQPGPSPGPR